MGKSRVARDEGWASEGYAAPDWLLESPALLSRDISGFEVRICTY